MPGLVPGIHVFNSVESKDVDGRVKPGHDDQCIPFVTALTRAPE
jgi:hypothetical protein